MTVPEPVNLLSFPESAVMSKKVERLFGGRLTKEGDAFGRNGPLPFLTHLKQNRSDCAESPPNQEDIAPKNEASRRFEV